MAIFTLPTDGVNMGVVKYLSDKDISVLRYRKIFAAGIILNLVVFCLVILCLFIFRHFFLSFFAHGFSSFAWISFILLSIFIQLINYFFLSVILSRQELKTYVGLNVLSVVSSVILVYYTSTFNDFYFILPALACGQAIFFSVTVYVALKNNHWKIFSLDIIKDLSAYRQLGNYIVMALSTLIFGRLVDFLVRQFVIEKYGLYETGLWQSAVKLSDYYSAAFIAVIGMVYYPKISELINYHEKLRAYLREVFLILCPVVLFGLGIIYFFKEEFLQFLFHKEFRAGAVYLNFQLAGDLFKLISFLMAYLIFAQARTFLFVILQAVSAFLYFILIWIFTSGFSIEGIVMAHVVRYVVYFIGVFILTRKFFMK